MSPIVVMIVAGALLVIAVGIVVLRLAGGGARQQRLAQISAHRQEPTIATGQKSATRTDRLPLLARLLEGTALADNLQLELLRAGWLLRPSEMVGLMIAAATFGYAIGALVFRSQWGALLITPLCAALAWGIMKAQQQRRQKALSAQIPDAIDMLSSSLRAGFAFMRGLQLIESQMHPPISEEFRRVIDEVQFGVSVEEALDNLIRRTGNYDLELIVAAVQTQLQLGGNLAEVLDNIAGMIRQRVVLAGELSAATAEGKMSASILSALPFAMAVLVSIVSPGYIRPLFENPMGWMLLAAGGLLLTIGILVIRKLVDVDI